MLAIQILDSEIHCVFFINIYSVLLFINSVRVLMNNPIFQLQFFKYSVSKLSWEWLTN